MTATNTPMLGSHTPNAGMRDFHGRRLDADFRRIETRTVKRDERIDLANELALDGDDVDAYHHADARADRLDMIGADIDQADREPVWSPGPEPVCRLNTLALYGDVFDPDDVQWGFVVRTR